MAAEMVLPRSTERKTKRDRIRQYGHVLSMNEGEYQRRFEHGMTG
jgi:hypothetical protein